MKEAQARLFAGLFFIAVFLIPKTGWPGISRYDLLLIFAASAQAVMLYSKLEIWNEVESIALFHLVGFALEWFKTSGGTQSWSYPEEVHTKISGVPLFAGFMYAVVGSYIVQVWRLFNLKVKNHPPYWLGTLCALAIYINFFTHHYIGDYCWYLAAFALDLYARTIVSYTPYDITRKMPFLLALVLIGSFIWLVENLGILFGVWRYPNQIGTWVLVHVSKWSLWALLVMMTFTIAVNLKHIKHTTSVSKD